MRTISAAEIIDKRVAKKTKKNYQNSICKFVRWLKVKKIPNALVQKNGVEEVTIPLPDEENTIVSFLGDVAFLDKNDKKLPDGKCIAVSTLNGFNSAIRNLYSEKKVKFQEQTSLGVSNFLKGYRRHVSEGKQKGEIKIFEGKQNLPFPGYCALALYAIRQQKSRDGSLFAHIFILLSWNLFARSISVASIMLNHLNWENDSLLITLPKHKGDQEGTTVYPKHVYANPLKPEICPVLGLAIYIFSTNTIHQEGQDWCLFSGASVESKFSHWLQFVLKENIPELSSIHHIASDLGTHSFRKGAVTSCLSFPGGPSIVSAYLRAGWSLGNVQQRYIFEGEGSDQFIGRVAAGLPLNNDNFTVLPPRINPDFVISKEKWKEIYPNYEKAPKSFVSCLPYLISSLAFHMEWLKENLSSNHALFRSKIWASSYLNEIKSQILCDKGECKVTNIKASGVPPHVSLLLRLVNVESSINKIGSEVSQNHQELISEMPTSVGNHILENFQVNGTVPITQHQFNAFKDTLIEEVKATMTLHHQQAALELPTNSEVNSVQNQQGPYFWGGRFHIVPESFRLEAMSFRNIWDLWFFGNNVASYPPIRKIAPAFDLISKGQRELYSKAKKVIELVVKYGRLPTDSDISQSVIQLSTSRINEIFDVGIKKIITTIDEQRKIRGFDMHCPRRYGEMSFTTLYNNIKYLNSVE